MSPKGNCKSSMSQLDWITYWQNIPEKFSLGRMAQQIYSIPNLQNFELE